MEGLEPFSSTRRHLIENCRKAPTNVKSPAHETSPTEKRKVQQASYLPVVRLARPRSPSPKYAKQLVDNATGEAAKGTETRNDADNPGKVP